MSKTMESLELELRYAAEREQRLRDQLSEASERLFWAYQNERVAKEECRELTASNRGLRLDLIRLRKALPRDSEFLWQAAKCSGPVGNSEVYNVVRRRLDDPTRWGHFDSGASMPKEMAEFMVKKLQEQEFDETEHHCPECGS